MRLALAAVAMVGCYAPGVPSGVRCSETGACPSGQTCIAGVCDGVHGGDGSTDSTPLDAVIDSPLDASSTGWAVPTRVGVLSSDQDDFGPSLFANGLRIYIASDRTTPNAFRIWYASRSSIAGSFSSPTPTAELDLDGDEYDPEVSGNGLELHYVSSDAPRGVRRTSRGTTSTPWTVPPELAGIAEREGPSLALDDTRMVVGLRQTGGIEEWQRTAASPSWVLLRTHPTLASLGYPGISADGLELYAVHIEDGLLFRATRATTAEAFGAPQRYLFGASIDTKPIYDPELTPDGKTMYLSIREGSSFDIFVTTRP